MVKNMVGYLLMLIMAVGCSTVAFALQDPPPPPPAVDYFPKRWKEFSSQEGGFKVLLPGVPIVFDTTHQTPSGDVVIHWVRYKGVIGQDVTYIDYAVNVEDPLAVKKFLDDVRDGGLTNIAKGNARIIKEVEISVEGHPGRFIRIEMADGTVIRAKYVAVKNRLYSVSATCRKGRPNMMGSENDYEEMAMAFLDSFQLTRR